MDKGAMQLLRVEIEEAVKYLPSNNFQSSLINKLNSALKLKEPRVAIQFTANELEILLDYLGAPLIEDHPIKRSLRKKVQTFLFYLRNSALKIEE